MKELVKNQLYQVKSFKSWVIAEYLGPSPAHTAKGYRSRDGARSWHEPDAHMWKQIGGSAFSLYDKGMQTRAVTPETLEDIRELQVAIVEADKHANGLRKTLRDLCS